MRWMVMTAALALAGCADGDATRVDDTGDTDAAQIRCPPEGHYSFVAQVCGPLVKPTSALLDDGAGEMVVGNCATQMGEARRWRFEFLSPAPGGEAVLLQFGPPGGSDEAGKVVGTGAWDILPATDLLPEMLAIHGNFYKCPYEDDTPVLLWTRRPTPGH